ncbi:FAD:protein FMN transferase [Streptomyces pluripotens]|uniref:FAD:protein FMN transferase n=1 Tax=Streptomyces pluripotens TaxID=1355015 RepID=A0A221NYZ6_9ACTN|nr:MULTISPECIES: FAD:protein FMN transferase [Streptomyces]ARP70935.1 thiamine biosynthesis protein [Streptomyces pluripotens]ASN25190.1 FAD:protein FMN transferase [Streptomyces pluripotens]MCH0559721.1 FAD:protein FMN transferase [Streptomyces sp. MUM 16J]
MTTRTPAASPAEIAFPALGTTAALLVTDPQALPTAEVVLRAELAAVDRTCSRFRPDSELTRVNLSAGTPVTVGALFAEAVEAALHAARLTDGAVDPTVGRAVAAVGYDRTFASLAPDDARPLPVARPAPGWQRIVWNPRTRRLRLPPDTHLDLGATAKAHTADRAARHIAEVTGTGVLVNLGGDLTVAGPVPDGGWRIALADDHAGPAADHGPAVAVTGGALATSGVRVRTWRRAGRTLHHIIDPATGEPAVPVWRTVSVAAATCVDANAVGTAAIVLGDRAVDWLRRIALPVRLVGLDGHVQCLGGWPPDPPEAAGGAR